jgi:hypothetical protein
VPGLALASIVTSNPERVAQARSAHPDAEVLPSAVALFDAADAVADGLKDVLGVVRLGDARRDLARGTAVGAGRPARGALRG